MLDIKLIREDAQAIADKLKVKRFDFDVAQFQSLDGAVHRPRWRRMSEQLILKMIFIIGTVRSWQRRNT